MNKGPYARTSGEMAFYASLKICPKCGRRVDPDYLQIYGGDDAWSLTGPCRQCKAPLAFTFRTHGNPIEGARSFGELGRGHSEIISPKKFIDEIERLSPAVETDPTKLDLGPWKVNRDKNKRVRVCLAELMKFIPSGGDTIPVELVPPEDQSHFDIRLECYRRDWVEALIDRHKRVTEANIADLPRIEAAEKLLSGKRPKGIDYLEREALVAHEKWVARGSKGRGRLILVDAIHEGMKIGRGVELSGARFDNVDFTEAYLEDARLIKAELENVRLERGYLYGSLFHKAAVSGGSFEHADLKQAEFTNARITNTVFDGAHLDQSVWRDAHIDCARFEGTRFGNANLDGATFTTCDFRQADFGASPPKRPPATRARFEHCDLRDTNWEGRDLTGATFVDCKFDGAKGLPSSATGNVIENAALADEPSSWPAAAGEEPGVC